MYDVVLYWSVFDPQKPKGRAVTYVLALIPSVRVNDRNRENSARVLMVHREITRVKIEQETSYQIFK